MAALAVAVAVAVHLVVASDSTAPVWMNDEVGYLLNAHALSGVGPVRPIPVLGYYSGWSVPLVPLWWVLGSPEAVYRGAVALSALCGLATIPVLATLGRRLGLPAATAWFAGALLIAYPGRAVMSDYALAENFLALVVALTVLAGLRYAARPVPGSAALLAGGVGYALFTHGRAAPLVVATALWFLVGLRRHRAAATTGLGVLGVLCLVSVAVNDAVQARVYPVETSREDYAADALARLDVGTVLTALAGHAWYQGVAWLGLAAAGVVIAAGHVRVEASGRRPGPWTWWCLASSGVGLLGAIFLARLVVEDAARTDFYVYGRYWEPFVVPFALLGVTPVLHGSRRLLGGVGVTLAALAMLVWLVIGTQPEPDRFIGSINIAGLLHLPWFSDGDVTIPLLPATTIALAALVLAVLMRGRPTVTAAVLLATFAASSLVIEQTRLDVSDGRWQREYTAVVDAVRSAGVNTVAFDVAERQDARRNGYQYWLDPVAIRYYDSRTEPPPSTPHVIAAADRPPAPGAQRLAADPGERLALWRLP